MLLLLGIRSVYSNTSICHFSLNHNQEYQTIKSMINQIKHKQDITVHEFSALSGDPNQSFLQMIKSSRNCNGLVVSGQHTGNSNYEQAQQSSLDIRFLEKLSCNPEYRDWFKQINLFHFQNCQTTLENKSGASNPLNSFYSLDQISSFIIAMLNLSNPNDSRPQVNCDSHSSKGNWYLNGRKYEHNPYSFNNPGLQPYTPPFKKQQLGCLLYKRKEVTENKLMETIDQIIADEALISNNFNALQEFFGQLKNKNDWKLLIKVKTKLKNSSTLNDFMMKKISSTDQGLLKKIRYYDFLSGFHRKAKQQY